MNESSAIGASVEGEKLDLVTRKWETYPPKKDAEAKTRYDFKLGMNGSAEITEAYQDPLVVCVYTTSMFEVRDSVNGTVVTGWAYKPLGRPNVKKASGTHSGTFVSISGGCGAIVRISPREQLQNPEFQLRNPQIVPVLRVSLKDMHAEL